MNLDDMKKFLENEVKLREDLKKQDEFILKIFNDPRISGEVKNEYSNKYNELKINRI
ncbi:hypothetical protein [Metabacillus fastidiosus]|uniref:hypothetical protein n=1 Tax=Metabacillus fastidiosus TaxID=1458 RepID=UPI003D2BFE4C